MTKLYLFVRRYLTVMMVFGAAAAFAQQSVSGKITSSDDGSGIPGVNILEKGTTNGTVSDADGGFTINVGSSSTLVFSFVGYLSQEISVGSQTSINVTLQSDVTSLSEIVVVGYGSQDKKELTSSVVTVTSKDFNKGNINDPTQLLQGKVAGLSIYNRGGDPNSAAIIRLRGLSTVGANSQPLIVVDGILGASLDNVDPNDIESTTVLKDGSAAAIYGSRGSSGVILVTTKSGSNKTGAVSVDFNSYVATSSVFNRQPVMSASQYIAAGGNNLGAVTDWQDLVTRKGSTIVQNLGISGGNANTTFRISANLRNVEGILKKSGFDQINTRARLTHNAFDNKLKIDVGTSFTSRNTDLSFNEALRYAVLFNPTAPVRFTNGEFYQAILFDNFNPVAIIEQNTAERKRKTLNFGGKVSYDILKDLTVSVNFGQQFETFNQYEYYSRNSLFRGFNRGGLARRATAESSFTLLEGYATYSKGFGKVNMDLTGGYSYQEDQFDVLQVELGNFPSDLLGYNAIETSGDRISGNPTLTNISSDKSPKNKIIAFFGRINLNYDNAIFFNASVRREGSSKLGKNNQIGVFPSAGLAVDINKYLQLSKVDILKLRVGWGITGSLPNEYGISQEQYNYGFNGGGAVTIARAANPDLKWEQKQEINLGVDFGLSGRLVASLDVYTRDIKDFILLNDKLDVAIFPTNSRFENLGSLQTRGIELKVDYTNVQVGQVKWTPGIVVSSYKTTLESYLPNVAAQARAPLGAPGQSGVNQVKIAVGEEIGQIWGPVFSGITIDDPTTPDKDEGGAVVFADLNGDGVVKANDQTFLDPTADYKKLGSGIPSVELGFTNKLTYKNWDFNAFFRAAFGHSLSNNFRAFYEPIDKGAINSYNRISTSKAVAGLTESKFSSLYVEKADFLKLDNLSIGYNVKLSPTSTVKNIRFYGAGQNIFVLTSYSGIDPEPVLSDQGAADNGGFLPGPDPLSPGIDRRNAYFTSRTFTFGVSLGF
jgi:TonB-dependent starch-binding outer membrane protein SusC